MMKIPAMCLFMLILPAAVFAYTGDETLARAVRDYRNAHYMKALERFGEAGKLGLDGKNTKFSGYAVDVITRFKKEHIVLERMEIDVKRGKDDGGLKKMLALAHFNVAAKLSGKEFYLDIIEPHLLRAVALESENRAALLALAEVYYSSMRYDKAVKACDAIIKNRPPDMRAYRIAGDASVAMGDYDKAREYYTALIKADDNAMLKSNIDVINRVKRTLKALPETYKDIDEMMKKEDLEGAETILKKRLSLNGADHIALTELGMIYQERGDRKNALKLYSRVVKAAPDYPIARLYLGRLYYLMREYDRSKEELSAFKEKMKLLPGMDKATKLMYIDSLYYLAEIYFTLQDAEEIKSQLDEIIALDPKQQDAYYDLGVYYYKYERSRSKAYQAFSKVIEMDSASASARDAGYAIEFIRANPDPRIAPDFSFIEREY